SNTNGMIIALAALNLPKGSAVITTPYTFVSTASSIHHLSLDAIFCDTEKNSYNIDAEKIKNILENDKQKKVKAIIVVHIAGVPCDMQKICALAKKYNVKVIEDAAHSFPSLTELGYCGTISDIGVFSFYATKTITTAEGGMICTRDEKLAKKISSLRLHGMSRDAWNRYTDKNASWQYDITSLGYKANLPDVLSALGLEQLKKAKTFLQKRKKIAHLYNDAFSKLDFVTLPPDSNGNAWHLYLLRINEERLTIGRDEFAKKLQENGIGISVHFIPLFYFSYWKKHFKTNSKKSMPFSEKNFPNAASLFKKTISLPLWPDMTESMIKKVISEVKKIGKIYHV
ncbi:MAG: DegT/DnrJ/EryC1/StrS family aminotransferase, partial [Treponema sp.]|nr:DegT/DnrJ/EryC1/StrS family aminotransferase [Treponema sp.]